MGHEGGREREKGREVFHSEQDREKDREEGEGKGKR